MRQTLVLFISIIAALFASASTSSYMRCSDLGLFWGNCQFRDTTLFAGTKTERAFSVRYQFSCEGHDIDVGFQSDEGFKRLQSSLEPQEITVMGRGLMLVDQDPKATSQSTFDSNCEFVILETKVSLSSGSRERLQTLKEESALIIESISALSRASESAAAMLKEIEGADLGALIWQRDLLRVMLGKIDLNSLPVHERIALVANLRSLDEMLHAKRENLNGIEERLRNIAASVFSIMSAQQIALLNRIAELKLRATEMLVDVGQQDSPDWADLFALFDKANELLEERV